MQPMLHLRSNTKNSNEKMKKKINIYLFLLFICLCSCKGQSDCNCNLAKKSLYFITYEEALSFNKQIIPCLIDSIDVSGTSFVGFSNPMSSHIGYHFNQKGIKYSYLIDLFCQKIVLKQSKKLGIRKKIFYIGVN